MCCYAHFLAVTNNMIFFFAENLYLFNVIIYIIIIATLCLHTETNFIQPVNKLKASVIVFSQIIFAKTLQWLIVRFRPRFLSALWVVRQS